MKADNASISKVFSGGGDIHYVLPHFQREYTWERGNWETLLNDALTVYEEMQPDGPGAFKEIEHFMGSIVVVHDGMRAATVSALKLVDGQQRLTSISLLLKALAENSGASPLAKKIERLLVNADESGDLYFKILPTTKCDDRSAYMAIMRNEPPPACRSRIPVAYEYFVREIGARIKAGLEPDKLFQVIIHAFQVVFVNLGIGESPYRIFESLNAKGKPLTQADLVRNYVAMTLPTGLQERLFAECWMPIENLLHEQRNVGKLPELTAFLRHDLAAATGMLCEEGHVYARFRDRAEREFNSPEKFEAELRRIARFAAVYDNLLRPEGISHPRIASAMQRLNILEASSAYPFLLRVFDRWNGGHLTPETVGEILACIENYMLRRFLAGEPARYLNRVFATLWGDLDKADLVGSLRSALSKLRYPGDGKLLRALRERALYEKSAQTRRRIILVLDSINRRLSHGSGGYTVLDGAATIEHIMPQTLKAEWKEQLGQLWEQVHRDYLHTLGNLTLVTGGWNSEMSNSPFAIKRPKLAENALRLNSAFFAAEMPRWGRDEVRERASALGEHVLALWPSLNPDPEEAQSFVSLTSEFHFEVVERISARLARPFLRLGPSRFESPDGTARFVGMCSKQYPKKGRGIRYWFAFKVYQREFLEQPGSSWVALECAPDGRALLVPYDRFHPWLRNLRQTEGEHWHIDLIEANGRFELPLPGSTAIDVTEFLV